MINCFICRGFMDYRMTVTQARWRMGVGWLGCVWVGAGAWVRVRVGACGCVWVRVGACGRAGVALRALLSRARA